MGMQQRLALAAAMLGDPDYLILDEPANGLDPEGIRWLRTFLRDFASSGRTVFISSHLLNEIEATADDIVVINKGRLLAQMPMSELNSEEAPPAHASDLSTARQALAAIGGRLKSRQTSAAPICGSHSHDAGHVGSALFGSGLQSMSLSPSGAISSKSSLPARRFPVSGVLRAELRRIATTKLWWVVLICIFVLSAAYAALPGVMALLQNKAGVARTVC